MSDCKHETFTVAADGKMILCATCGAEERRELLIFCNGCNEWKPSYNMSSDALCNVFYNCADCNLLQKNPQQKPSVTWS